MLGRKVEALPAEVRGDGPDVLILPAFGIAPWAYQDTVEVLARHARVIVADWLRVTGRFTYERALDSLEATLEEHGIDRAIVVGHSFGGALGLGLAARRPDAVHCLLLVGSVALSERWKLAYRAIPGDYVHRLATFRAAIGFLRGALLHPFTTTRAALWGFFRSADEEIETVRAGPVETHVLWAERDTLLDREDGRSFAQRLGARFTIVRDPHGAGPVDHDWLWRHPQLLEDVLDDLQVLPPRDPRQTVEHRW